MDYSNGLAEYLSRQTPEDLNNRQVVLARQTPNQSDIRLPELQKAWQND